MFCWEDYEKLPKILSINVSVLLVIPEEEVCNNFQKNPKNLKLHWKLSCMFFNDSVDHFWQYLTLNPPILLLGCLQMHLTMIEITALTKIDSILSGLYNLRDFRISFKCFLLLYKRASPWIKFSWCLFNNITF